MPINSCPCYSCRRRSIFEKSHRVQVSLTSCVLRLPCDRLVENLLTKRAVFPLALLGRYEWPIRPRGFHPKRPADTKKEERTNFAGTSGCASMLDEKMVCSRVFVGICCDVVWRNVWWLNKCCRCSKCCGPKNPESDRHNMQASPNKTRW